MDELIVINISKWLAFKEFDTVIREGDVDYQAHFIFPGNDKGIMLYKEK